MNRSFRLLRPISLRPPALSPLLSKSAFRPGPPSAPITWAPRVVGIRLYVTPSHSVRKDSKLDNVKEAVSKALPSSAGEAKEKISQAMPSSVGEAKDKLASALPASVGDLKDKVVSAIPTSTGQVKEALGKVVPVQAIEGQRSAVANAMAEARDVISDIGSIISGGQRPPPKAFSGTDGATFPQAGQGVLAAMETSSHSHPGNVKEDFVSVTTGLMQSVPQHVLYFGLAGTLPYLGTAVGTVFLARETYLTGNGIPSLLNLNYDTTLEALHTLESVQITYGAVILSFLGALHWGMEFVGFGGEAGYKRLMVGTLPLLLAWPTVFMSHGVALAFQWVGYTTTWFMDQRATQNGWTPEWFATYRFYLSIIVGFSIIGTLAGTSYYEEGAGAVFGGSKGLQGHESLSATPLPKFKSLDAKAKSRSENATLKGGPAGVLRGTVGGDIAIEEDEGLEAYGKIVNKAKAAEEDEEEEEEEEEGAGGEEGAEEGGEEEGSGGDEGGSDDKGAAGAKNTGLR